PQPLRLTASGHGLAVPGWIEAMELSAAADLDPAQDLLSATEGVRISGQAAPEFRKLLPEPMQGANTALVMALEPGFTFARAPGWRAAGRATLSVANGALRLATQADLTVAPDGTLSGTLDSEADADRIAFGLARVARTKIVAPLRIATGKSISLGLTAPA